MRDKKRVRKGKKSVQLRSENKLEILARNFARINLIAAGQCKVTNNTEVEKPTPSKWDEKWSATEKCRHEQWNRKEQFCSLSSVANSTKVNHGYSNEKSEKQISELTKWCSLGYSNRLSWCLLVYLKSDADEMSAPRSRSLKENEDRYKDRELKIKISFVKRCAGHFCENYNKKHSTSRIRMQNNIKMKWN